MVKTLAGGVMAVAATVLCACAIAPASSISPLTTAAALDRRSLDDPGLAAFLAGVGAPRSPGPAWDLDALTLAAVYFHPDLDIAYARLAVADAGVTTARQLPNPTLDFTPQFNTTTTTPSPWTVGPAISLLIETFGKRGYRIEQSKSVVESARADVDTAAWQVRGRVRTALIDLWVATERSDLTARRLEDQSHLVTQLEHRLAVGDASALDVSRERSNRDQLAIAVRDAETATNAAKADLAAAIGIPARALDRQEIDLDGVRRAAVAPPSVGLQTSELRRQALTTRSDVRAALASYAAADAGLRLQLARRYPNVTLGASYSYDQGDNKYGLSLAAIELPIFNQNQGPIAEAAAHRKEAAATFLGVQAKVIGAMDSASAADRGSVAGLAAADALVTEQAKRQSRSAETFSAGQIDRPALLAGQLELDAARILRLDAATARLRALGQLEDALQQPVLSKGFAFATTRPPARPELDPTR